MPTLVHTPTTQPGTFSGNNGGRPPAYPPTARSGDDYPEWERLPEGERTRTQAEFAHIVGNLSIVPEGTQVAKARTHLNKN